LYYYYFIYTYLKNYIIFSILLYINDNVNIVKEST